MRGMGRGSGRGSYPGGRRKRWTEADVDRAVSAWSSSLRLGHKRKDADLALKVWCMERWAHPAWIEVMRAAQARLMVVLAEEAKMAPDERRSPKVHSRVERAEARKRRPADDDLSSVCCVVDQLCTRPANLWGVDSMPVLRSTCVRCGQSVCRNCSSLRTYNERRRQRLCNDCQVEVDGNDHAVMERLRAIAR